jgi:hypothetical protein
MAYVDKLVDTQDAVIHDFKGDGADDAPASDTGSRPRKRSDEVNATDAPRQSTFREGDFNCMLDNQCQFHRDAKHTM